MRRVIKDLHGITHRFEGGVFHNTRCGKLVWTLVVSGYEMQVRNRHCRWLRDGVVDCMACLVGPTRLTSRDLADSPEIEVVLRLVGVDGGFVGNEREVTLVRGICAEQVVYDDTPIGVVIAGVAYLTHDGDELYRSMLTNVHNNFCRRHEGDTLHITVSIH